jgi:hypothetical protein
MQDFAKDIASQILIHIEVNFFAIV